LLGVTAAADGKKEAVKDACAEDVTLRSKVTAIKHIRVSFVDFMAWSQRQQA
jgi:hypothetical protein